MPKVKDKSRELEILISTMNRTSLDFLFSIFSKVSLSDYSILVINQTTENKLLTTEKPNVRVINSFEKGLSKSRNLAIKNATKPFCLLADDDVVFIAGFQKVILDAHHNYSQTIITFQTITTQNKLYWKYPTVSKIHNELMRQKTLSVEISFKKAEITDLRFDERFGLGATFEDGENYIFLSEANKKGKNPMFINKSICIHEPLSSSDDVKSDRLMYAKSAIHSYKYENLAYFWVFKFVFFLFRKKYISFNEIGHKLKVGFKGIQDFKKNKDNDS